MSVACGTFMWRRGRRLRGDESHLIPRRTGKNCHSFIGLFTGSDQPIRFIAPSTSRDSLPVWSADGKKIAFLRQPGAGGTPRPPLARFDSPWKVLVADVESVKRDATDSEAVITAV